MWIICELEIFVFFCSFFSLSIVGLVVTSLYVYYYYLDLYCGQGENRLVGS